MTAIRQFFLTPTGQLLLIAALVGIGALIVRSRWAQSAAVSPPAPKQAAAVPLPQILKRNVARFTAPNPPPVQMPVTEPEPMEMPQPQLPLGIYRAQETVRPEAQPAAAPFGRLIPCETVFALESSRLDTPIIALVTEDVWHAGQKVIPAGAEVHGRGVLDPARERIAGQPGWRIVWRTSDRDNGLELATEGIALDRDHDSASGQWGPHDGSAGLRGQVIRTSDHRELQLFAASFLASATAALQDTRTQVGALGEMAFSATTARNAALAGTSSVLREHAQAMREAIARDGFYLRVPAGKPFYLYITQTLDRGQARTAALAPTIP